MRGFLVHLAPRAAALSTSSLAWNTAMQDLIVLRQNRSKRSREGTNGGRLTGTHPQYFITQHCGLFERLTIVDGEDKEEALTAPVVIVSNRSIVLLATNTHRAGRAGQQKS